MINQDKSLKGVFSVCLPNRVEVFEKKHKYCRLPSSQHFQRWQSIVKHSVNDSLLDKAISDIALSDTALGSVGRGKVGFFPAKDRSASVSALKGSLG